MAAINKFDWKDTAQSLNQNTVFSAVTLIKGNNDVTLKEITEDTIVLMIDTCLSNKLTWQKP